MEKKHQLNPDAAPQPYLSKRKLYFLLSIVRGFSLYILIRFFIVEFEFAIYFLLTFIFLGGILVSLLILGVKQRVPWYYLILKAAYCPKCNTQMDCEKAEDFDRGFKRCASFRCSECDFVLVKGFTYWEGIQIQATLTTFFCITLIWFTFILTFYPAAGRGVLGIG